LKAGPQSQSSSHAGKGDLYREVPLNSSCRQALTNWLAARSRRGRRGMGAVHRSPGRLSARAVDLVVRSVAGRAGLQLSAHLLRHTCVTNLVRSGNDLVLVAELAGHRRLETTRRYSLPSAADRQAAMDALEIED
jgi:site-specific recombinase XerD